MYPLAIELWVYIIRQLSRRDLMSTSSVCSTFRRIAQAQLFHDVRLVYENEPVLFARALAERHQFTSLVFKLDVEPRDMTVFTSHPMSLHISSLSNLHTLHLVMISIDSKLCVALQNLPKLKEIRLEVCEIDSDLDALETQMAWGHNLSTTVIINPEGPEASWAALVPPTIKTLTVHVTRNPHWPEFPINDLITGLISSSHTFEITTLALPLTHHEPGNIIALFISCPQLRHLTLDVIFDEGKKSMTPFPSLPSHALPMLEHFSGPAKYIDAFVSGRRIHSVDIYLTLHDSDNALTPLYRSLVNVTKLRVEATKIRLQWIRCIPVTLRYLEVRHRAGPHDLSWITALPKMSTLCTLRVDTSCGFRVPPNFVEPQEEVVNTLSAMFNSLRELIFEWQEGVGLCKERERRTWRWRQNLPWESYKGTSPPLSANYFV